MEKRNATVAVIGAGDYIGTEIAKKFAAEGFTVFAGRRDGAKLEPLVRDIEAAGGSIAARALDARKADEVAAFLNDADKHAPLEVCIFNVGANVNFPVLETTDRVFRKVWEMACWAGFVAGRESARLMLPRGKGNIFFTGATASLRGGSGFAAFASAKFGLRAVAPVKKMLPLPRGSISRADSRPATKPAQHAISHTFRNTRSVVSRIGKLTLAPTLKMQTSSAACLSASLRKAVTSSSFRASSERA